MSSSQGANGDSVSGYPFNSASLRDASDWIQSIKQSRIYQNYKSTNTDNQDTEPYWLKYGNNFRLTYSNGRFKCEPNCDGNVFASSVGDAITSKENCPSCTKGPTDYEVDLNNSLYFTPDSSHLIYPGVNTTDICIGDVFSFTYNVTSPISMNYAISASGIFDVLIKKDDTELEVVGGTTSQSGTFPDTVLDGPCLLTFKITVKSCSATDIEFGYGFPISGSCAGCDRLPGTYPLTMAVGGDIAPGVFTNLYDAAGLTTNCVGDTFQLTYVAGASEGLSFSIACLTPFSVVILKNGTTQLFTSSGTTNVSALSQSLNAGDVVTFSLTALGCDTGFVINYSSAPLTNSCPACTNPGLPYSGSINAYPAGTPTGYFPAPYVACIGDVISLSYNVGPGAPPGLNFGVTFDTVPGTGLFTATYSLNGAPPVVISPSPVTTTGLVTIPVSEGDNILFALMVQSCDLTNILTTYQYPI